jgi:hypothetical protein
VRSEYPTPVRIVTKTPPKTYPPRPNANRFRRTVNNRPKVFVTGDPGGTGWEVVRERAFCPACAARLRE